MSLQMSILAHKNKFSDVKEVESLVAKIPENCSTQDRRRYELMIRSGVLGK